MIFRKHWTVALLVQKESEVPRWVKWIHEVDGIFHCLTCLKLHERWFAESKAPLCPQHENCHCRLDAIDYAVVLMNARANSNYRKFDPYLFDPENFYKHGKNKAFESWGYSIDDAPWLQAEIERQALQKYVSGDYKLGKLDHNGQRISIRIEIPRKDREGTVSFVTGWMVEENGTIKLNTPYGGE